MENQPTGRWAEEAAFFDGVARDQAAQILPLHPTTLRRYRPPSLRRRFKEEFRFQVLGDVRGKRVLDVGCGDGSNSLILAKMGAQVTGIDISPGSIELAQKRAEVNGVSDLANFICSPLEEVNIPPQAFDVIWGDSILHHLINSLKFVMERLDLWAKPGGLMVFSEPMNFNSTLRRIRLGLPIHTRATPDERPLEPREVELVRRFLPDMQIRFYWLLGRFSRFILTRRNYERSSLAQRALVNLLVAADYPLLSLPVIRDMGGYAVFYGHTARDSSNPN